MKIDDDDFKLFDLPRRFVLERDEIDRRWKALQSRVHPDRFAADGAAAQRLAMQWAVRVNEAHQRLKDPVKRAAYLCELSGQPIAAHTNTAMPAAFLMQQMAWREALDDAANMDAVERLATSVRAFEAELLDDLAHQLDTAGDVAAAAQAVRSLMFVSRFLLDVDRRIETLEH